MIIKVAKNELIKTFHHKQFYILVVFIIIMALLSTFIYREMQKQIVNGEVESGRYSQGVEESFINMNASIFMEKILTDFIFKPMIPFFVIFMVLFSIRIFSEDNISGNLKFFLLDVQNRMDIYYGKVLYLFIIISIIVVINILLGFILGGIVFGIKGIVFKELLFIIFIYLLAIIPVFGFSTFVGSISLLPGPSNIFIVLGIMLSVLLSIADKFTISKYFSPIGIISKVVDVKLANIQIFDLIKSNFVAFLYFILAALIGNLLFKKKDWVC